MTQEQIDHLRALHEAATPGPWTICIYDCGDTPHYDHNGPCPSIQAEEADACVVHWDGFKQEYWSSANGDQRQIDANAALIAAMRNALPDLLATAERVEVLEAALQDTVSTNAENSRQRDLMSHHLGKVLSMLDMFLTDYAKFDEVELIGWLGKDMGQHIIASQMAARSARAALEQKGSDHG